MKKIKFSTVNNLNVDFTVLVSSGRFNPCTEEREFFKVSVVNGNGILEQVYWEHVNHEDGLVEIKKKLHFDFNDFVGDVYHREANGQNEYQGEDALIDIYLEAIRS